MNLRKIFVILVLLASNAVYLTGDTVSSLRDQSAKAIAQLVIDGKKNLAQLKTQVPQEVFDPIVNQVKQLIINMPSTFKNDINIDQAASIIRKAYDNANIKDPEFAGEIALALATRYKIEFNKKAVLAFAPGITDAELETKAQQTSYSPASYTAYAVAHLHIPEATQWFFKNYLKNQEITFADEETENMYAQHNNYPENAI